MVSILNAVSFYPCLFSRPLRTIPMILITFGITVIFIFHNLFGSLARSMYLSILMTSSFSWYGTILNINRCYITQNPRRTQLFQIRKVFFLTTAFHSSQSSNHERKIDWKNYLCHRNAIRFMDGSRTKYRLPFLHPVRPFAHKELESLSSTQNSELLPTNKTSCLYKILIISFTNDGKNTCH